MHSLKLERDLPLVCVCVRRGEGEVSDLTADYRKVVYLLQQVASSIIADLNKL